MQLIRRLIQRFQPSLTLALVLLVTPSLGMAWFGIWSLADVEDLPTQYTRACHSAARSLSTSVRRSVLDSLPSVAVGQLVTDSSGAATLATVEYVKDAQRRYLAETTSPYGIAAFNFIGEDVAWVTTRPLSPYPIKEDDWTANLRDTRSALIADGDRDGFAVIATRPLVGQTDPRHQDRVMYVRLDGGASQRWTAWLLDTDRLALALKETANVYVEPSLPLRFEVAHLLDDDARIADAMSTVAIDRELLPMWTLVARLDRARMPIGGETWRSRTYIVIAALTVPLFIFVVWVVGVRVKREVEEAKQKVDFVANVTHELKTPLTSIRMFIEMLLMGRTRSEQETRESLEIVLRESERLGRLIDRVLDFNRLERQKKVFNFTLEQLARVVRETVVLFRTEHEHFNEASIKVVIEPGLPPVMVDRDAIREVLLNLLSNAFKYAGADKPVTIRMYQDGRWIVLDVVDQGPGIPPSEQPKIFEKFYRVDNELSRSIEGTGLGLAISLAIVKAHGGTIEVESAVGQGARFSVHLPVPEVTSDTGEIEIVEDEPDLAGRS